MKTIYDFIKALAERTSPDVEIRLRFRREELSITIYWPENLYHFQRNFPFYQIVEIGDILLKEFLEEIAAVYKEKK